MKRSVLKILPSCTVHVTPAQAAEKLRALRASGLFKFVGVPLRKQVESVTLWVEMLVTGRAPNLPDARRHISRPSNQSFLLLLACGCCPKLTNHVEESFTGREELTRLYSTVPSYDLKKIHLVSLQPFAMCIGLTTVEQSKDIKQVTTEVIGNVPDLPLVPAERACSSGAAVVQLAFSLCRIGCLFAPSAI